MMTIKDFIKSYPVLSYFIITFAISWGGFILVVGSNGFSNTNWQADPSFPFAVMVMLAGPSVAGLLMTSIFDGKAGLSSLLSRLLKWRVGVQWYGIAILTAPVLSVIALFALSIKSPIFTADDKAAVVLSGIMAGLTTVFEEIGWTGFVVPRLRLRHSIFSTGLVVGVIWGAWHLLQQVYISGTYTGEISLILYLSVAIFNTVAGLTAYRVLLVWIYDRTSSLLLVWLMHASLTACNIFIFRPETSGVPFLIFGFVFTALQWILVAGIFVFKRGRLSNGVQSSRRFDHGGM